MATTTATTNLPALGTHEREEAGRELQATLVELIDLSLIGKQLHWTIVGPNFQALHENLDQLVDAWRDLGDTVAERAVALGISPDGQAHAVAEGSELQPVERAPIEDRAVVRELVHRVAVTSENVRARLDRLGEIDLASQDVLIEVLRELEKQQWMLRAQLGPAA